MKLGLLRLHPKLYVVEHRGRWAGLRRFLAGGWKVYYQYWDSDHTIYVETIWLSRRNDEPEE